MQRNEIVPVDEQAVSLVGQVEAPYERPVTMYLGTVSAGSRMTLLASLNTAARLLGTERRDQLVVNRRVPLAPWSMPPCNCSATVAAPIREGWQLTLTSLQYYAARDCT